MAGSNQDPKMREQQEPQRYAGGLAYGGYFAIPRYRGLTAGTTQTQAGAVALRPGANHVGTVAVANDGARLPGPTEFGLPAGTIVHVINRGANAMRVWPHVGGKLNAGTTDATDATTLAANTTRTYVLNDDLINWDWV